MRYQRDSWAEATVAMHCLLHPEKTEEVAQRLPPDTWKTHVGIVFGGMVHLHRAGRSFSLRTILEERTSKGHYEGSVRVGWRMMVEESTLIHTDDLIEKAIESMWQAHAEAERAKRIEKLSILADKDYSAYLSELDALVRLEKSGNPSLQTPEAESMAELNAAELRTAESIVGEGLLNESGLMWIHAPDGAGKTLLSLQLASSIALGRPWLEEYDCRRGNVVYLQGELSRPWWQKRTRDLQGYENSRASRTDEDSTIGEEIRFIHQRFPLAKSVKNGRNWYTDMSGVSTLDAIVKEHKASVVFIDPLSKFYNLEENSTDQNREFMGRLLDLRRSTGVTLVIVHHDRKMAGQIKGFGDGMEMRGSSALRADADSSVRLQYIEKKDSAFIKTEVYLVWEKVRHAKNPGKLRIERVDEFAFFEKFGGVR